MIITRDFVFAGISSAGGWSRAQVEELGVPWPLRPGWIEKIVGTDIPDVAAEMFLNLKDAHISGYYADSLAMKSHMRSIQ